MTERVVERGSVRRRHLPTLLREVSAVRTVGFQDAVDDLGTHTLCGHEVPYSKAQVYAVLQGRHKSVRLLERIAEKRPDMFGLRFVDPAVKEFYEEWKAAREAARSAAIYTGRELGAGAGGGRGARRNDERGGSGMATGGGRGARRNAEGDEA